MSAGDAPEQQGVRVWWPGQDQAGKTESQSLARDEIINLMRQVGLQLQPPTGGAVEDFHVVQLVDQSRFEERAFGAKRAEPTINFRSVEGSLGVMLGVYDHAAKLTVQTIKTDGSVGDVPRVKNKSVYTADDVQEFTIGDIYAGAGYFAYPDRPAKDKVDAARLFLTPLSGLVISLRFHPVQEDLCLGNARRYPNIIQYRVDGIFSTTTSASWHVKTHAITHHTTNVPRFVCSPLTRLFLRAQTLKTWRKTKDIDKDHKTSGANLSIPAPVDMSLYPVHLNPELLAWFVKHVPESWRIVIKDAAHAKVYFLVFPFRPQQMPALLLGTIARNTEQPRQAHVNV
jgi:hypothetical protein